MIRVRPRWRDDRGSLPFAMLLTLIGTAVSSLLVPVVLVQLRSTQVQTQRVRAVEAAQAGLDVALGQLRRANDGQGNGDATLLPCGTLTGYVGGNSTARYSVTIQYFQATDTTPMSINCTSLSARTPLDHAFLTSTGTAGASRTLTATYRFWTTTENLLGGLVPTFPYQGVAGLCMDAGSAHPTRDTAVQTQPCSPGSSKQIWAYTRDLTLELVSSTTSPYGPMCVDAGSPHVLNNPALLEPCGAPGSAPLQQKWSLNNHANFEGTTDGVNLDNYCLIAKTGGVPGSPVVLGSGDSTVTPTLTCQQQHDNQESWTPDPSVGAGAAGAGTGQLVNYFQFGRCLDVPRNDLTYGYLIVWPCKQAPDPSTIGWNEKWIPLPSPLTPGKYILTTTTGPKSKPPNTRVCLTTGVPYVFASSCATDAKVKDTMEWTMPGATNNFLTGYRLIDKDSNCLSPNDATVDPYVDPIAHVTADQQISKGIVVACTSSSLLKWNVIPGLLKSLPLTDVAEN